MATTTLNPDGGRAQLVPVPALSDNYIWLVVKNGRALVVDPGVAEPVTAYLEKHGLALDAILLTHHHHDHVGGVRELKSRFNVPVYGPAQETLPACDFPLKQDDRVHLPALDLEFSVIDIPGHTAGHIAYFGHLHAGKPVVFCGDTLFAAGCGRLFEGSPAQMVDSLGKLSRLPSETLVCCAHEYTVSNLRWALEVEPGNSALRDRWVIAQQLRSRNKPTLPSSIGVELETNPFIRTDAPEVCRSAENWSGESLNSNIAVFTQLREWKNSFA